MGFNREERRKMRREGVPGAADPFGGELRFMGEDRTARGLVYQGYMNLVYEVHLHDLAQVPGFGAMTQLAIMRLDKAPPTDWRHMQRIKNTLCGAECEAIELYPAESRLVDTKNNRTLWVLAEGVRFGLGWERRMVTYPTKASDHQRPFEPGQQPLDAEPYSALMARWGNAR